MSMFNLRRSQKQSGFTLMELLIVIAVLGLLLGMLIPRLAGITDDTVDTVCDTNNKGTRYLTQMYINKYNSWPNQLTNLVDMSGDDAQAPANTTDGILFDASLKYTPVEGFLTFEDDQDQDAEVIAAEFWSRTVPGLHALSKNEASELHAMGISTVFNKVGADRPMEKVTIAEDTKVMMMGMASATKDVAPALTFDQATYPVGNPEWLGRIMFAVNDKCSLVTEGILQASALCPGAVLNEENFEHKEYVLVLPRLQATVDKFEASDVNLWDGAEFFFYDSSVAAAKKADARQIDFVFEAQPIWNFDMSCPEGHKWPDNDEDHWMYDTSKDSSASAAEITLTAGSTYTNPE